VGGEDENWSDKRHPPSLPHVAPTRALKAMGVPLDSPRMLAARRFVLSQGGLLKAKTMTRFWLALFGNVAWDSISYVPLFVFQPGWIGDLVDVQVWLSRHRLVLASPREDRPELGGLRLCPRASHLCGPRRTAHLVSSEHPSVFLDGLARGEL